MRPPSRRQVLVGLAALGMGCASRPGRLDPLPEHDMRLGWRFVRGQELGVRVRVTHTLDGVATRLSERWTYVVRALDGDRATLEAHLVGLGGGIEPEPARWSGPVTLERARATHRSATVILSTQGRLGGVTPSTCSTGACFGDRLPHALLSLALPAAAVSVHDTWPDPDLALLMTSLLPAASVPQVEATTSLLEVHHGPDGRPRVALGTAGVVRPDVGPVLRLDGRASWDPTRGVLLERTLQVRATGIDDPGLLTADLTLLG